jgi:outer membrane receptor protein involved in Fe transport
VHIFSPHKINEFRVGFNWIKTSREPTNPRGIMSFTHQFTDNAGTPGAGGNSLATLLTGQPEGGSINNLNNIENHRNTFALFLQDDWRILPKLTLNLGMRYEYFSPVYSAHDAQANFNPVTGNLDIPTPAVQATSRPK